MSNEIIIPDNIETKSVVIDNQDKLDTVVKKALDQIEAILDVDMAKVPVDDKMKMLSVKKDAATAIINAGLKADENRFRRQNNTAIERLFDKIKKESKIVDGRVIHKV